MMKYSHVIFDIDGTIIDNDFVILQSLQETLLELTGCNYPHEELQIALGVPSFVPLKHFRISDITEGTRIWFKNMSVYLHHAKPFPGVVHLLNEFRWSGLRLGIVTSRSLAEYMNDFLPYGLGKLFGTVICSDDTIRHKPEPEPLLTYLERSGIDRTAAIYVGDSGYDIECANAAGVDCGHALWGGKRKKHPKATYHFSSPTELRDTVFEINSNHECKNSQ